MADTFSIIANATPVSISASWIVDGAPPFNYHLGCLPCANLIGTAQHTFVGQPIVLLGSQAGSYAALINLPSGFKVSGSIVCYVGNIGPIVNYRREVLRINGVLSLALAAYAQLNIAGETGPAWNSFSNQITVTLFTLITTNLSDIFNNPINLTGSTGNAINTNVKITTPNANSSYLVGGNYVVGVPTVTSCVDSNNGTNIGPLSGCPVTIIGTNFSGLGTVTVTIGGLPATSVVVNSDTVIHCNAPAHVAGLVNVVITLTNGVNTPVSGTLVNGFEYHIPVVTSITPDNGTNSGGTPVTLVGQYFGSLINSVKMSNIDGTVSSTSVVVVNETHITAVTHSHVAGITDVIVTDPTDITTPGTLVNGYTYLNITDPSGVYKIVSGKTSDTNYVNSNVNNDTIEVKIPNPFAKTGFIGG